MKAYLSTTRHPEDRKLYSEQGPEMAYAEARRILGETEAGGETYTYGHHRFEGQYLKTELSRDYNRQGVAELAEALATFIDLEVE